MSIAPLQLAFWGLCLLMLGGGFEKVDRSKAKMCRKMAALLLSLFNLTWATCWLNSVSLHAAVVWPPPTSSPLSAPLARWVAAEILFVVCSLGFSHGARLPALLARRWPTPWPAWAVEGWTLVYQSGQRTADLTALLLLVLVLSSAAHRLLNGDDLGAAFALPGLPVVAAGAPGQTTAPPPAAPCPEPVRAGARP